RELGEWRGKNNPSGWRELSEWARTRGEELQWGVEGAWSYGRGLAQHLVADSETVYEVNARWTAAGRRRAKRPGKSDPLDARAVALVVRQEAPDLPAIHAEDQTAVLDLLTVEREGAIAEATRLRNQIHALLVQLDPEYEVRLPTLKSRAGLAVLTRYLATSGSVMQQERAAAGRRLAERL